MCGAKTTVSPATSTTPTTHSPSTPKPTPSLATDNYVINGSVNGTNVSCLVMKAAIKFSIPYEGKTKVIFFLMQQLLFNDSTDLNLPIK